MSKKELVAFLEELHCCENKETVKGRNPFTGSGHSFVIGSFLTVSGG